MKQIHIFQSRVSFQRHISFHFAYLKRWVFTLPSLFIKWDLSLSYPSEHTEKFRRCISGGDAFSERESQSWLTYSKVHFKWFWCEPFSHLSTQILCVYVHVYIILHVIQVIFKIYISFQWCLCHYLANKYFNPNTFNLKILQEGQNDCKTGISILYS